MSSGSLRYLHSGLFNARIADSAAVLKDGSNAQVLVFLSMNFSPFSLNRYLLFVTFADSTVLSGLTIISKVGFKFDKFFTPAFKNKHSCNWLFNKSISDIKKN